MWDGMREQYYRLSTELRLTAQGRSNMSDLQAALRRLTVALEMVAGYREMFVSQLSSEQIFELQTWERVLQDRLNRVILAIATEKGESSLIPLINTTTTTVPNNPLLPPGIIPGGTTPPPGKQPGQNPGPTPAPKQPGKGGNRP
jgi:hypothetical protein